MGTTTPGLIPYPEPTDPVAAGAANMRAIAEAVDPKLNNVFANKAAITAWSAPNGAHAFDLATGLWWTRMGGIWYRPDQLIAMGSDAVNRTGISTTAYTYPITLTATVPAGRRLRAMVRFTCVSAGACGVIVELRQNGVGAGERMFQDNTLNPGTGGVSVVGYGYVSPPSAGTHTYTFSVQTTNAPGGYLDIVAGAGGVMTRFELADVGSGAIGVTGP